MNQDILAMLSERISLETKQVNLPEPVKSWDGDSWQWEWVDRIGAATWRVSLIVREDEDNERSWSVLSSAWADPARKVWSKTLFALPFPSDSATKVSEGWLGRKLVEAADAARRKATELSDAAPLEHASSRPRDG